MVRERERGRERETERERDRESERDMHGTKRSTFEWLTYGDACGQFCRAMECVANSVSNMLQHPSTQTPK